MSNPNFSTVLVRPNTAAGSSGYVEQWTAQPASSFGLPGDVRGDASSTLTLAANTATIVPIFVDRPLRVTSAAFVVTTAVASTNVRVALFKWDSRARSVGALINDFGSGSGAATGQVNLTSAPTDLAAGWYALVVIADGAVGLATILGSSSAVGNVVTISGTTIVGTQRYTIASLTGAPASGFASVSGLIVGVAPTAVTSTSDYRQVYPAVFSFVPSPVAVNY